MRPILLLALALSLITDRGLCGQEASAPQTGQEGSAPRSGQGPDAPLGEKVASVPSRSSTRWQRLDKYFQPPKQYVNDRGHYRSPLRLPDGSMVQTAEQWTQRRAEILRTWQSLLGEWPPLIQSPQIEYLKSETHKDYTQHQIRFAWTPSESTTGYLLIPTHHSPGARESSPVQSSERYPAVITVYYEPETAIGEGKPFRDFAIQLARRGFITLSIGTTEATQAKTYGLYYPSLENTTVQPLSMLAYAAANAWHVLASLPEVDSSRIGIVGHSFGGKWAMFASCLFDKFACAAWSDPGIVFDESRPSVNYWEPWYLGYHPKPWRPRGIVTEANPARGLYPQLRAAGLDLHELHALMAPRPFLVSGGSEDPISRWQALNHSVDVNRILGYEKRVAMTNRPDHAPNEGSNTILYEFFEHFLLPPARY